MKPSTQPSISSRISCANGGPENFKEMLSMKYKEIISSTFPKPNSPYELCQYQGFWFPLFYLEGILTVQETFKAHPSDIFLCSSIKTGTTWLKALTFSIMIRDLFDNDTTNPLLTKVPHECIPNLEHDYNNVNDQNSNTVLDTEFPLLSTHLPYTCLPRSIIDSDCRIIYICREPKDTFVSLWHFFQKTKENIDELRANSATLEQHLESFCEGKSVGGPYWDHVFEYRKASVDRSNKVLFLKYEDLKGDTLSYVKKLAEFIGKPFSKEEEMQGVAEKIVARCSFQNLSNLEVNKSTRYFRKGEIGDWKNHLSEDMAKSIDNITQERNFNIWT